MVAGLALAAVIAVVVLWQFIGLLGGARALAVAQADAASAVPAAASVPVAATVAQEMTPSVAVVPAVASAPTGSEPAPAAAPVTAAIGPAAPTAAATPAASMPSVATRLPAGDARPVPLIVPGASAPSNASQTNTAALAASSPARARPGKPVPTREGEVAVNTDTPQHVDDDTRRRPGQAVREPNVAARPVPTFTPSGPRSASEVCGRRVFLALAICMDRECERPIFRDQPDCMKVLEMKRQRENR